MNMVLDNNVAGSWPERMFLTHHPNMIKGPECTGHPNMFLTHHPKNVAGSWPESMGHSCSLT